MSCIQQNRPSTGWPTLTLDISVIYLDLDLDDGRWSTSSRSRSRSIRYDNKSNSLLKVFLSIDPTTSLTLTGIWKQNKTKTPICDHQCLQCFRVASFNRLETALKEPCLDKNNRACLIVAGDFNAPGVDWEKLTVKLSVSPKDPWRECAHASLEMLGYISLQQLVHEPTKHKAILDLPGTLQI